MSKRFLAALPVLALFLSNCGGGGGGGSTLPSQPVAAQSTGSAQIKLTIPNSASVGSHARTAKSVSPGANGVTVAAGPHGGTLTTTTFDISVGSTLCQTVSGARTCTLNVTVPSGSDDIIVTLYLLAPVNGAIPAGAPILGVSTNLNVSVIPGHTASIVAYVMPTISNVTTSTPSFITVPADGQVHGTQVMFNPVDYANSPIVTGTNDNYSNPITVSVAETGGSGLVTLSLNGGAPANSVTLTKSSDVLGVSYNGGGSPGYHATVTASATGVSPQTFNVVPMFITSSAQYYANSKLAFTGGGEAVNFTISEAIGFNSYTSTYSTSSNCSAAMSTNGASGSGAAGTLSVGSLTGVAASADNCQLSVADGFTSFNIPVTNTTTGGTVSIGGITEYNTPISMPQNIVAGADGLLYVTGPNGASPDTVWTYDTTGTQVDWSNALDATPTATAIGPDGLLWFVAGNANFYTWNKNPNVSNDTLYGVPGASANVSIIEGSDGNMWIADSTGQRIVVISPATHWVLATQYSITGNPGLMASSANSGWVYFLTDSAGTYSIGKIAPGNAAISYGASLPAGVTPAGMAEDIGGNVWITDSSSGLLYVYNPVANSWTPKITSVSSAGALTFGQNGLLYFTDPSDNQIVAFNTSSGATVGQYKIPTTGANPTGITLGHDGRIWFTESAPAKIGAINP